MQLPRPVRTYLDPDTVGPLPRSSHADDSDALAAARTVERRPMGSTMELAPEDVLEIFDPSRPRRPPESIAPVGYDQEPALASRRHLGGVVVGVVAAASLLIAVAALRQASRTVDLRAPAAPPAAAPAPAPLASDAPAAIEVPRPASPEPVSTPASGDSSDAVGAPSDEPRTGVGAPSDRSGTGTLRVDPQAEGHRAWVDGVVLTADAAIVRCGEHRVKVGSLGRTRTIDVPCGGEITVFR